MEVKWTPEQQKAINMPSGQGNILVSAAAGSGKTAVLVERIFQKIKNEKVDIDKFLVVTFTNAAADGMKEKIEQRFRKEIADAPHEEKTFWQKQLRLVDMADINTMDAYCLNILKNNFQNIGIDPNFFILDDAEYRLLREETAENMFERLYDEQNGDFLSLIDKYASFKDDSRLTAILFKIHSFISNFAEPMEWLKEKSEMYMEDMSQSPFVSYLINDYLRPETEKLHAAAVRIKKSISATDERYKPLADSIEIICTALTELNSADSLNDICEWNIKYDEKEKIFKAPLPAKITAKLREIDGFEECLNQIRTLIKKITEALTIVNVKTAEEFTKPEQISVLIETAGQLYRLTKMFDDGLMSVKHKRNAYTFLDIEHMTYELFKSNSDIRRSYTNKYYEILIDEYQDTNGLQDAIFASISHDNIFMVGDLKQSIYRFRGGDPYIFKDKSKKYKDGNGTRIDLAKNFRSRADVIDSVNSVFDSVMSDAVGDVDYSGDERLKQGVEGEKKDFYRSELHIIKKMGDLEQTENDEIIEAEYVAKQILRLKGQLFADSKKNISRPLQFSDFTILVREKRKSAPAYEAVFEKYNIPLVAEVSDYFENVEIKAMTALISVIDNVRQDIPLITALRSALFNFTDSDLAYIKINCGKDKDCFYESIEECAETDNKLSAKCRRTVGMIKRWRAYTREKSVAKLIRIIYEETGFYDFAAVAGGETAQSNLLMLYERAKSYENSGAKGLFSFVKYIDNLKERSKDIAGAKAIRNDTVTLMTIHKSKGLEFPIVFLSGMGRNSLRARADRESRVLLHKDWGIGLMYPDAENGFYQDTVYKKLIEYCGRSEEVSEKMRVLYVAMTRAQYKLIATAVCEFKDDDDFKRKTELWSGTELDNIRSDSVAAANEYVSWIVPAAMKSKDWDVIFEEPDEEETAEEEIEENIEITDKAALKEAVYKILDYEYPYSASGDVPSRTTATEMKAMNNAHKRYASIVSKPMFMTERKSAAKRGTAYHNAAAFINLDKLKNGVSAEVIGDEIERMCRSGYVNENYIDETAAEKLLKLFTNDIGKRMIKAEKIYREKNFQVLMDSSDYKTSIPKNKSEKMILQGVIDCFFIEDGEAVLIDYKTDKIRNGDTSAVKENYTMQLDLYTKAIQDITGLRVKERYLYLFDIDKEIQV